MLSDTLTYVAGADWNYDIAGSTLSTPNNGDVITRFTATREMTLPQNLSGSPLDVQSGPNGGTLVITIKKNGGSEGIFTWSDTSGSAISADMSAATTSISGNLSSGTVSFAVGDILEIELTTVSSADDISVTLKTVAS